MGPIVVAGNGALAALERNKYFYGKMMDVAQFEKEQRYFLKQARLLNRLTLGIGVVSGLDVIADATAGTVTVQPGVALDRAGRVIVVPAPVVLNPAQLTDDAGNPSGDPVQTGTVILCLAYAERYSDPVATLVQHCDTPGDCAPSTVREEFRILVRLQDQDPPAPAGCGFDPFPTNAAELHGALSSRVHEEFEQSPAQSCVPLARVTIDDFSVDASAGTPLVYGNALLHSLLVCLTERTGGLAGARVLRYVSGDGQAGATNQAFGSALVVELTDGAANPVNGVAVQFTGDGTAAPGTVNTDAQGRAQTTWTAGPNTGEQQMAATAAGSMWSVTFRASAQ